MRFGLTNRPGDVAERLCEAFSEKASMPISNLFVLSVLAGAYVGFGCYVYLVVSSDASRFIGAGLAGIVSGVVFSLALILIVVGGAELFTGNGLQVLSCLSGRVGLGAVLRNWAMIYVGNLVGALILVALVFGSGIYSSNGGLVAERAVALASYKVQLGFWDALLRGVLCNWLVCLAIWLAATAEDTTGKILACIFPVSAFVASGFEHSIANMFFIPLGILVGGAGSAPGLDVAGIISNLVPVTLGNIIGGGVLVAATYWYVYIRK